MIGIIDTGGALRGAFADGVLDRLQDEKITAEYFIGVSAGAANGAAYVAEQRGRNLEFYTKHIISIRAIGPLAWLKTGGSFVDLDYIYGTLSASTGKSPLDYQTMMESPVIYRAVATDVKTGEAVYFDKHDMKQDDYRIVSASSCTPLACKPYTLNGNKYFDGYISDPIPVERAIADGCDKLLILLTLPKDHMRSSKSFEKQAEKLKKYPAVSEKLKKGAEIYNRKLQICLDLEKEGKALILYPQKVRIGSFEKDRKKILALYQEGYDAGRLVKDFIML